MAAINSALDSSATTITIDENDITIFDGCYILIDSEVIRVSDITSLTLTIVRGQKNTTAASHSDDAAVYLFFPINYSFRDSMEENSEYLTTTIQFESGKKQIQRRSINKLRSWKVTCKGLNSERQLLIKFHDAVGGNSETFYFFNPDNEIVNVRFGDGKLPIKPINELDLSSPSGVSVVGYSAEITMEAVI